MLSIIWFSERLCFYGTKLEKFKKGCKVCIFLNFEAIWHFVAPALFRIIWFKLAFTFCLICKQGIHIKLEQTRESLTCTYFCRDSHCKVQSRSAKGSSFCFSGTKSEEVLTLVHADTCLLTVQSCKLSRWDSYLQKIKRITHSLHYGPGSGNRNFGSS